MKKHFHLDKSKLFLTQCGTSQYSVTSHSEYYRGAPWRTKECEMKAKVKLKIYLRQKLILKLRSKYLPSTL